jgi:hypothetical protein
MKMIIALKMSKSISDRTETKASARAFFPHPMAVASKACYNCECHERAQQSLIERRQKEVVQQVRVPLIAFN